MAPILLPFPMRVPAQQSPCIVVEGVRYCPQSAVSPARAGGFILLGVALLVAWLLIMVKLDREGRGQLAALLFFGPLIVAGCSLLIWSAQ